MIIEALRLHAFRNYRDAVLKPHPGMNLFFGANGSGKTNLLEAVHYCALGRSHRSAADRETVMRGETAAACGVTAVHRDGTRSEVSIRLTPEEPRKKQVFIDRKRAPRIADLMGHVRCVIFSPEDLQLVREGPAVRRRFMDMMISQADSGYFTALQRYGQALDSRNALLRDTPKGEALPADLIATYEALMAEAAAVIMPKRLTVMARLADAAAEKYAAISGREGERFRAVYSPCCPDPAQLAALLAGRREEDRVRGTTGLGIHREDIRLSLMGREMKLYASQGQVRTAALALKLAQMDYLAEAAGDPPVLLLDDVMSELDMNRRTRLLREIGGAQTFVTCTDESDLEGLQDRRTYAVSLGEAGEGIVRETRGGALLPPEAVPEDPDFT